MSFAPRQNHRRYDAAVSSRKLELCQAASISDRFRRYAEYFDSVLEAKTSPKASGELRKTWLLEKLAMRKTIAGAFHLRDEWIGDQRTSNDAR
jgi:hypothetical protein